MSDLLNSASLVMIPSGYKEDVVYSQIPTSGAGDLSFTRASNGTRVNSAGLVEVCPWNLATYSEDFSAVYSYLNATISNNTTSAPNATTTADSLLETTATDIHAIFTDYTQQSGVQYTYSVYVKSISGRNVRVSGSSGFTGPIALVDLSNGSLLSGSTGASVESVGNGWYRISLTATTTTTTVRVIIYSMNGTTTTFAGSTSNGVYLWGAQLNIGSTAKPYFPTTDRLNVPRLTYQNGGGGCPSLLLEKQSTNILLNSEELNSWLKIDTSVTSNSTISPDGTQNADTVTATGSGSLSHLIYQNLSFTSGTAYTYSVFAKANTSNFIQIIFSGDFVSGSYANFNLSNGTITASANLTPKIESMGNGWYRCSISATAGASNTNSQIIYLINSGTASRGQAFTANGESVYLWGGQFEASSYPTSYIPTTSSSATRVADAFPTQTTTIAQAFTDNSKGTIFFDLKNIKFGGADAARFRFGDSSSNLQFALYIGPLGVGVYSYKATAGFVIPLSTTSAQKLAVKFDGSTIIGFSNGVKRNTITASSSFSIDQMTDNDTGDLCWEKNQFILFNAVLTDAECISLTTI